MLALWSEKRLSDMQWEESSSIKVNQSSVSLRKGRILDGQNQHFPAHHDGLCYFLNKIVLESVGIMQGGVGKVLCVMVEQTRD